MYPCEITTDGLVHGDPMAMFTGGYGVLRPTEPIEPVEPKTYKRRVDYLIEEAPSFGLSFDSYIGKIYKNTFIKMRENIDVDFVQ